MFYFFNSILFTNMSSLSLLYIYICVCVCLCFVTIVFLFLALCLLLYFSPHQGSVMEDYKRSEEFNVSSQNHETAAIDKRYGGLVPKKRPLITKDHERAFFDSADWALCKQGAGVDQNSKTAIETLRPKLQRTPHQQLPPRRPACTS